MKKIIWIVVLVAVLAGVCWFFFATSGMQSQTATSTAVAAEVPAAASAGNPPAIKPACNYVSDSEILSVLGAGVVSIEEDPATCVYSGIGTVAIRSADPTDGSLASQYEAYVKDGYAEVSGLEGVAIEKSLQSGASVFVLKDGTVAAITIDSSQTDGLAKAEALAKIIAAQI